VGARAATLPRAGAAPIGPAGLPLTHLVGCPRVGGVGGGPRGGVDAFVPLDVASRGWPALGDAEGPGDVALADSPVAPVDVETEPDAVDPDAADPDADSSEISVGSSSCSAPWLSFLCRIFFSVVCTRMIIK
jgi:hypothetical protein